MCLYLNFCHARCVKEAKAWAEQPKHHFPSSFLMKQETPNAAKAAGWCNPSTECSVSFQTVVLSQNRSEGRQPGGGGRKNKTTQMCLWNHVLKLTNNWQHGGLESEEKGYLPYTKTHTAISTCKDLQCKYVHLAVCLKTKTKSQQLWWLQMHSGPLPVIHYHSHHLCCLFAAAISHMPKNIQTNEVCMNFETPIKK